MYPSKDAHRCSAGPCCRGWLQETDSHACIFSPSAYSEVPTEKVVTQEVPVMVDKVIVRDVPYPVERFVEKDVVREVQKVKHAFLSLRKRSSTPKNLRARAYLVDTLSLA